jgi:hypothetical protein
MNEQADVHPDHVKRAIVELLGRGAKRARFMTEIVAGLRRLRVGKDELERALSELEAAGKIVLRDHYCADPHLADVDLRVAALLDQSAGAEAHAAALHEIDLTWNKWLGEYLANHRCG